MPKTALTYAAAGVDIDQKDSFTESLDAVLKRTYTDRVIPNPGGFAGLVRLDYNHRLFARNYKDPVLVACCDGVGTKVKLAAELQTFDTVGIDLVAMNVNDLVVQGAEPLLFLDYIATPTIDRAFLHDLVKGIAEGCRRSGCALIGGETAHMPDLYARGDFDLAGFCVGVVELKRVQRPTRVSEGDVILGLSSDGIHSNGYSLVRKVVAEARLDLRATYPDLLPPPAGSAATQPGAPHAGGPQAGADTPLARAARSSRAGSSRAGSSRAGSTRAGSSRTGAASAQRASIANDRAAGAPTSTTDDASTLGKILLTPTRLYADPIVRLLRAYRVKNVVTGMAHITGSGIPGNLCRALPPNLDARVDRDAWPRPRVFSFLQSKGNIPEDEMWRVFNMGIGYCLIVKPAFADAVAERLTRMGERVFTIGSVVKGRGEVRWA
jgi:phosphoribosylformylglycinamidine cyclo-ligase